MMGRIVVFRLPPGTEQNVRVKFGQRFWGQTTTSHGGRYQFHRQGLMDEIPHRKVATGVILVRDQDVARVERFLAEYGAVMFIRPIELLSNDLDRSTTN